MRYMKTLCGQSAEFVVFVGGTGILKDS